MSICHTLFNQLYTEFQRTGQISGGETRRMTEEEIVEFNSQAVDLFRAAHREDNQGDDLDVRRGEIVRYEACNIDPEDVIVTTARVRGDHRKGELEINDCDSYFSSYELLRADDNALIGFNGFTTTYATSGEAYYINRADLKKSSITTWESYSSLND